LVNALSISCAECATACEWFDEPNIETTDPVNSTRKTLITTMPTAVSIIVKPASSPPRARAVTRTSR